MATPKSPKRPVGRPKAPPSPDGRVPDLVVRGLTAGDVKALEEETAARNAELPEGASMSRNAVAVAVIREGLDVARKRREKAGRS